MRVAIITIGNLYRLPYLDKYVRQIPKEFDLDIICWNREDRSEVHDRANVVPFNYEIGEKAIDKIKGYLKYRRFAAAILQKNEYDRVIATPTQAGLLLADRLMRKYAGRYILDVRDYCHENLRFVRRIEEKLVDGAFATVVSSDGYKSFLPEDREYVLVHNNRRLNDLRVREVRKRDRDRTPITLSFVGYIAYKEQHKKMIDLFKNDNRFRLLFAGAGSEELKSYCEKHNIWNVTVRGVFDPNEILDFYQETDIVNGVYGDNCPELDYALSNKLYLAAATRTPIVSNRNTFAEELSTEYHFGVGLDMSSAAAKDRLLEYYRTINWELLDEGCRSFLERVSIENQRFEAAVSGFFSLEPPQ